MSEIYIYIIKLLLTSLIIEIGGYLINDTSCKNIYKFLSSIIFITIFLTFNFKNSVSDFSKDYIPEHTTINIQNQGIDETFSDKLSLMIEQDIQHRFDTEVSVETDTDFKKIKIRIDNIADKTLTDDILQYVRDKYCSPNDEVESDV